MNQSHPSTTDEGPDGEHPQGFGSVTGTPGLPDGFREQFASRYVEVDGVRLHVVTGGAGPGLLLIGGWPQFWWQWRHVMGCLARSRSVVAVDPRGIGLSDRPQAGYDTGTVAAELHTVMERLGHDAYDLVGHDVGMWIAYAMAADRPSAVRRLALIDAALPGVSPAPSALPDTQREVQATWHFLFNRLAGVNEALIQGREELYLNAQFPVKAARPEAMPPEVVEVYLRAQRQPDALRGSLAYYRDLDVTIPQNRRRSETPLTMPVLAVGGATSRAELVAADARAVASDVVARSLEDCGHYVPEEAPAALLEELGAFLDRPLRT